MRIQVLSKQEVPCFNEVVALVQREESRRALMLEPHTKDSSAMVAKSSNNSATNFEQASIFEKRKAGQTKVHNRDNFWCTYCKKTRHTRERCWKLHGKPPSHEYEQKGEQPENNSQAHVSCSTIR